MPTRIPNFKFDLTFALRSFGLDENAIEADMRRTAYETARRGHSRWWNRVMQPALKKFAKMTPTEPPYTRTVKLSVLDQYDDDEDDLDGDL